MAVGELSEDSSGSAFSSYSSLEVFGLHRLEARSLAPAKQAKLTGPTGMMYTLAWLVCEAIQGIQASKLRQSSLSWHDPTSRTAAPSMALCTRNASSAALVAHGIAAIQKAILAGSAGLSAVAQGHSHEPSISGACQGMATQMNIASIISILMTDVNPQQQYAKESISMLSS